MRHPPIAALRQTDTHRLIPSRHLPKGESVLTRVADSDELNLLSAMLEAVLSFYEKFAEQNAANPKLQIESATNFNLRLNAAKAYRKVGQVNAFLVRPDKGGVALRRSIGMLDELLRQYPERVEVQREFLASVAALEMPTEHRLSSGERIELVRRAFEFTERELNLPARALSPLWRIAKADDGDKQLADSIRLKMGDYRPPQEFRGPDFRPGGERPMGRPGEPVPRRQ